MKPDKLFFSMNDIEDDYVAEYAEKTRAYKTKRFHPARAWGVVAACLALVIICTPALIHSLIPARMDDPRSGVNYYFRSYSEFCDMLPDGNILANIPNSEKASIGIHAICPSGTTDFTDYNNFSYFFISVHYDDDGTGLGIDCTVNAWKSTEEYVESHWLTYPPDKTSVIEISGHKVYYTFSDEDETSNAIFSVDGDMYELRSGLLDMEELIQYITDMLNE